MCVCVCVCESLCERECVSARVRESPCSVMFTTPCTTLLPFPVGHWANIKLAKKKGKKRYLSFEAITYKKWEGSYRNIPSN